MPREEAKNRIRDRIEKGQQLLQRQIGNEAALDDARVERDKWSDYNVELLRRIVDTEDLAKDYYPMVGFISFDTPPFQVEVRDFYSKVETYINYLESVLERLELIPEAPNLLQSVESQQSKDSKPSDRIFVVHGHDEEAKQSVARLIEKLGLKAIILHEKPNQGQTIIEKFESYADVGFAVVLLTPDDVGASKSDKDNLRPRARQNVILELGFFIGRLGRQRVCALHKGNVEIPSDFSGILWVTMGTDRAWQFELGREMKAAGLDVDMNKLVEF
jgi:predicted nucleotide-binding protein